MLSEGDTRLFLMRNEAQATNLKKGLLGRHQQLYLDPIGEARRVSPRSAIMEMRASNPYAHTLWFRAVGGSLGQALQLCRPDFELREPLYFITLSDRRAVRALDRDDDLYSQMTIEECVKLYRNFFWGTGFNMIGMVEPAMYVYCGPILGSSILFHYHLHSLVWGTTKRKIKEFCENFRQKHRTLITYCTSADYKCIESKDFLQMVWYISKYPRKQHQVYRADLRIKSFKGKINGVNAVRQYAELGSIRLPAMTIAQGEGVHVVEEAEAMVAALRRKAPRRPNAI